MVALTLLGLPAGSGARGQHGAPRRRTRAVAVSFGNTCSWASRWPRRCSARPGWRIHVTLVSLHALVLLSVLTALVELDLARDARKRASAARATLRQHAAQHRHPPGGAAGAGRPGLERRRPGLPAVADEVLPLLGSAVVPVCLVLIGLSLAYYGVQGQLRGALRAVAAPSCWLLPALVLVVAHWGFGLAGLPLAVVVMMAALPVRQQRADLRAALRDAGGRGDGGDRASRRWPSCSPRRCGWRCWRAWAARGRVLRKCATMSPNDIPAYMAHVGAAARAASTAMAAASTAAKNAALRALARAPACAQAARCRRPTRGTWTPPAPPAWPRRWSTA